MELFETLEQIEKLREQLDKVEKLAMDLDVKKRLEKDKVIEKIIISTLRYRPAREIHFPTARPDIFDYEIVCRFEYLHHRKGIKLEDLHKFI